MVTLHFTAERFNRHNNSCSLKTAPGGSTYVCFREAVTVYLAVNRLLPTADG